MKFSTGEFAGLNFELRSLKTIKGNHILPTTKRIIYYNDLKDTNTYKRT